MKKRILIAAVLMGTVMLAGCGETNKESADAGNSSVNESGKDVSSDSKESAFDKDGHGAVVEEGACGERWNKTQEKLKYTLYEDGTLYIAGEGTKIDTDEEYEDQNIVGNEAIKNVYIEDGIKDMMGQGFYMCTNMESIRLPDDFNGIITNSYFEHCESLKSIDISMCNNVAVGKRAFKACYSLQEVKLPEGLKKIGIKAFDECESLTSIELPDSLETIDDDAFSATGLTSIEIPDSVTTIGIGAFGLTKLTTVELPEGLTSLQNDVFNGCENLTTLYIPESVESIDGSAVIDCPQLKTIKGVPGTSAQDLARSYDYTFEAVE